MYHIKPGICQSTGLTTSLDRKSTRLNSSHANISYAVFCLKKKMPLPRWHQGHKVVCIRTRLSRVRRVALESMPVWRLISKQLTSELQSRQYLVTCLLLANQ